MSPSIEIALVACLKAIEKLAKSATVYLDLKAKQ